MCDERERLIEYLYDACDADERRRVEAHLASCEELPRGNQRVARRAARFARLGRARARFGLEAVRAGADDAVVARGPGLGPGGGRQRHVPARHRRRARGPAVGSRAGGGDPGADVARLPTLQPAPVLTTADHGGLEQRIATTVQSRLEGARAAGGGPRGAGGVVRAEQTRRLVQTLLGEGEIRQAQAIRDWPVLESSHRLGHPIRAQRPYNALPEQ